MHREWVTGQVYSEHKTGRGKTQVGWLEVTFKLGLAHPLLVLHTASAPLQINLADTGNIVCIDPPGHLPNTEARFGAFDLLRLRIRRECTDEEGQSASLAEFRKWKILSDAGKVLWWFFETVRESDFRENNSLSSYPVAPAEEIQDNALVKTCDLESSYDGAPADARRIDCGFGFLLPFIGRGVLLSQRIRAYSGTFRACRSSSTWYTHCVDLCTRNTRSLPESSNMYCLWLLAIFGCSVS
jgi:hypothetical protein